MRNFFFQGVVGGISLHIFIYPFNFLIVLCMVVAMALGGLGKSPPSQKAWLWRLLRSLLKHSRSLESVKILLLGSLKSCLKIQAGWLSKCHRVSSSPRKTRFACG